MASKKKAAPKKTAPKKQKNGSDATAPRTVEGQEIIGETACGNHYIVKGDDGVRHVAK